MTSKIYVVLYAPYMAHRGISKNFNPLTNQVCPSQPEFRLPNKIVDVEIDNLKKMGVHFQTDCIIGKTISVKELEDKNFKGIFIGSGAGLPNFMGIPGENALNIKSSN